MTGSSCVRTYDKPGSGLLLRASSLLVGIAMLASPAASGADRSRAEGTKGSRSGLQQAATESTARAFDNQWWAVASQQIVDSEYDVTWQTRTRLKAVDAAWHATNRAHDFRTYFTMQGIRVVPRDGSEAAWVWGLEFSGVQRGPSIQPGEGPELAPYGNRLEYARGSVVEWYVNDRKARYGNSSYCSGKTKRVWAYFKILE